MKHDAETSERGVLSLGTEWSGRDLGRRGMVGGRGWRRGGGGEVRRQVGGYPRI